MHYFSTLFGKELYMFQTDLLSIIRSLNTVFTAIDISHTSYVAVCLQGQDGTGLVVLMVGYCPSSGVLILYSQKEVFVILV
jgi:hypothetical protein